MCVCVESLESSTYEKIFSEVLTSDLTHSKVDIVLYYT